MPSSNNTYFECREELLLDLREPPPQLPRYAEDDDPLTRLLQSPLEEPEWIVVVGAHDRRMLSTAQVSAGLRLGELTPQTLVWRGGMRAWAPIAAMAELNPAMLDRTMLDRAVLDRAQLDPAELDRAVLDRAVLDRAMLDRAMLDRAMLDPAELDPVLDPAELNGAEARRLPPQFSFPRIINPAAPRVLVPAFESDAREPSPDPAPCPRVKQAVMGLSALIMFGVFLTMFAISSARDNSEQRDRARAAEATSPVTQATEPSSTSPPEDLLPTAAALLSETDPDDTDGPPVQPGATRHPDTRQRY